MRKLVTVGPREMTLEETTEPEPSTGQALVRVEAVGLCGSDYHLYLGDHPYVRFPLTQGHELAGVVEAFGPGYEGPLSPGQRVAIEPLVSCGRCFACRRGHYNCCASLQVMGAHIAGGLAEQIVVGTGSLHAADGLEADEVALVEPISIGVQAVTRGGIGPDDTVVVLGAGPIGQAVLLAAADRGATVLVADRIGARLRLAAQLGAHEVVDTSDTDLLEAVLEWTGNEGAAVVVDASGSTELVRVGVDAVAPSGTVVIVGLSSDELCVPLIEFTRKELNVVGSRNNAGVFGDAVDLVRRQRQAVDALITHRFPLEQTPEAIEFALEHPEDVEKIIIRVADGAHA